MGFEVWRKGCWPEGSEFGVYGFLVFRVLVYERCNNIHINV